MNRACVALALGLLTSCAPKERAPGVTGDRIDAGEDPAEGPAFVQPESTALCGQTTVGLELVRNNLYFVLDASGSMTATIPGTEEQTRYEAAVGAVEEVLLGVGHRALVADHAHGVAVHRAAELRDVDVPERAGQLADEAHLIPS